MANNNNQGSNIPWWLIVLCFAFGLWPIALVLLFLNLGGVRIGGSSTRPNQTQRRTTTTTTTTTTRTTQTVYPGQATVKTGTYSAQPTNQSAAQSTQQTAKKVNPLTVLIQKAERKVRQGRIMTIAGGGAAFVFLMGLVDEISSYGLYWVSEWFPLLGFFLAGLTTMGFGISRARLGRRQRLYLGVIGNKSSVFLSDLAATAGVSEKKVISDLQKMLSDGTLPMGYIDRASGRLVLSDQGYEAVKRETPKQETVKKETAKEPTQEEKDQALLREIREINDAIPGDEMSRKIDRIEEITGKILAYARQNPKKSGELRQFLNYYLPTTLKILRAYAQMDAQGIEGENITAAKERIEGMMDKVVDGFEKQLDQLFQADAMDITSDVEVLERMLQKDGLGGDDGITLTLNPSPGSYRTRPAQRGNTATAVQDMPK